MGTLKKAKKVLLINLSAESEIETQENLAIHLQIMLIKISEDYEDLIKDHLEVIMAAKRKKKKNLHAD